MADNDQTEVGSLAKSFGHSLASERELAQLSIADLARKAKMQRAYVWRVEQGKTLPNLRTAARLALALEVPLSKLVANIDMSELRDGPPKATSNRKAP